MVKDNNKCEFAGCENEGTLLRQSSKDGAVHRYCPKHDPLEDDRAFGFTEFDNDE